jgi:predicted kinase
VDATAQAAWQRTVLADAARAHGALFLLAEVRASDEAIRGRLAARAREAGAVSDAGWEVYVAQKARLEPVTLGEWTHLVLDGDRSPADVLMQLERELHDRLRPPRVP